MSQTKVAIGMVDATGTPGSGNFLRGDSTWNAPAAGGWTFINTTDISNAATYVFTATDASSYDGYGFFLQNVVPVTDAQWLEGRTSTDGGSSYDSGASDYSWGNDFLGDYTSDADEAFISFHGDNTSASYSVGSATNESGCSGWIWLIGPHLTGYTMVSAELATNTGEPKVLIFNTAASRLSNADVDAFQLFFGSGNIETGTITVYGLANA